MSVSRERETRVQPEPPDARLGVTFDGYSIEECIGRGGMGVVYRATQLSLKRPVAIKFLPDALAGEAPFLDRFRREVDVMSRLSHPNIVTVLERGNFGGHPYLVMELVQGTSLREVLRKGPLPAAEALVIVRSILAALEHAHRHGIIHRDIKPENVLLAPGGIVKVADFGLSRLVLGEDHTRLTHTHLMLGTYEYMSPEQRERASEADERSDLYATGVVLYEAIAGELPIGRFESLSDKRPHECDRRIDQIVERSLEKSPERRYQEAEQMGADVSRLISRAGMGEAAIPAPAFAPPEPEESSPWARQRGCDRRARRAKARATLVAAFLVAGIATANGWRIDADEWFWLGMLALGIIWIAPHLGRIFRAVGALFVALLIAGVIAGGLFLSVGTRVEGPMAGVTMTEGVRTVIPGIGAGAKACGGRAGGGGNVGRMPDAGAE